MKNTRIDPAVCGICARGAVGFGYAPPRTRHPPLWVCDDPECLDLATRTYEMKQDKFDRLEAIAAAKGAEAMGARLEELGKSDVFQGMEWEEFLDAMRAGIAGYRQCLKAEITNEVPF